MMTTIPVFRDCVGVLMEQEPSGLETADVKKEILAIKGIESVNDLHIWVLSGGKNCLTAHIFLEKVDSNTNYRGLTHKVYHKLE